MHKQNHSNTSVEHRLVSNPLDDPEGDAFSTEDLDEECFPEPPEKIPTLVARMFPSISWRIFPRSQ